jgi:ABC-type multidrug transport system permease subunit
MRVIGHLTPVAWAMEAFRSLIFEQGTLLTILPSLGVLSAMTAAFFAFAIWRFRYN